MKDLIRLLRIIGIFGRLVACRGAVGIGWVGEVRREGEGVSPGVPSGVGDSEAK